MNGGRVQLAMTERPLSLLLGALGLIVGVAFATAAFVTVSAAPCDPSLPVLSDGTREAPQPWAYLWASLYLAAGISLGVAGGFVSRVWATSRTAKRIGAGVGIGALIVMWIAGAAFWTDQCPV